MEILKYKPVHEKAVLDALKKDPDWDMFINDGAIGLYKKSLKESITYVSYSNSEFCGFVRAFLDEGFAIYISELYVIPKWRNQKIGLSLLERVKIDFPSLTVYALSDEDAYYDKLGYKKIGSVFELN